MKEKGEEIIERKGESYRASEVREGLGRFIYVYIEREKRVVEKERKKKKGKKEKLNFRLFFLIEKKDYLSLNGFIYLADYIRSRWVRLLLPNKVEIPTTLNFRLKYKELIIRETIMQ